MAYLLDTHVILWALDEDNRLSASAEKIISNQGVPCYISVVSFFEIAIKKKIGKLELQRPIKDYISEIERIGITILPIRSEHLDNYEIVPLLPNHGDPFDRLILATAFSEKLIVISADEKFGYYNELVEVVW